MGLLYVAVGAENDDHPSCFFVMLKGDMTFIANPDTPPKSLWKLRDSDYSMMGHELIGVFVGLSQAWRSGFLRIPLNTFLIEIPKANHVC